VKSRLVPTLIVVSAAVGLVAGCSSLSGTTETPVASSGSTASTATASAAVDATGGLKEAQAAVAAALQRPQPVDLPVLSSRPEGGKHITFVTCPLPTCAAAEGGAVSAGKVLGWTVDVVQGGLDPIAQNAAWNEAIQGKPDAIVAITAVPYSALADPMAAAKAAGIPVVTLAGDKGVTGPVISALISPESTIPAGKIIADWAAVDSNGAANIALFSDPANLSFTSAADSFQAELKRVCPGCVSEVVDINSADIGTKIPTQVVSYVQAHPDVKYIGFTLLGADLGVPEALAAAGQGDSVKVFGRATTTANQANIAKGTEAMGLAEQNLTNGWVAIDALARHFVGDPLDPCCLTPGFATQILNKENVTEALGGDTSNLWDPPELEATFKRIWRLTS
jgi:ABC-type sugar transport system substrate-binding protein